MANVLIQQEAISFLNNINNNIPAYVFLTIFKKIKLHSRQTKRTHRYLRLIFYFCNAKKGRGAKEYREMPSNKEGIINY